MNSVSCFFFGWEEEIRSRWYGKLYSILFLFLISIYFRFFYSLSFLSFLIRYARIIEMEIISPPPFGLHLLLTFQQVLESFHERKLCGWLCKPTYIKCCCPIIFIQAVTRKSEEEQEDIQDGTHFRRRNKTTVDGKTRITNLLDKKCHKTNVFIENESLDCRYYYPKVFFSLSRHEKKWMWSH